MEPSAFQSCYLYQAHRARGQAKYGMTANRRCGDFAFTPPFAGQGPGAIPVAMLLVNLRPCRFVLLAAAELVLSVLAQPEEWDSTSGRAVNVAYSKLSIQA